MTPPTMQGGVYFSKDSKEILLNGESYGNAVPADEEDLTSVNGSLQLKDRSYDLSNFLGKGYKILRKNISNGKNILTLSMISDTNTIYEIRYDFDLNNKTITIPEGCILRVNGGSFNNGTISKYNGNLYSSWFKSGNNLFDSAILGNCNIILDTDITLNSSVKYVGGFIISIYGNNHSISCTGYLFNHAEANELSTKIYIHDAIINCSYLIKHTGNNGNPPGAATCADKIILDNCDITCDVLYEYAETCIIINSNIICNKILIPNVGELKLIIDNSIVKPNTADKITIIDDLPNPDYFYSLKLNLGIVNSLLGDYYPLSFKRYPVYVSVASSIFLGNKNRGATSDRPTIASVGFHYYDTDLGRDVVWDGTKWYDPHAVTKSQVGLGNVDNTSDKDKPVSDATQLALDEINGKLSWTKID